MNEWQDMETAPRDGSRYLIWDGHDVETVTHNTWTDQDGVQRHEWVQVSDSGRGTSFSPTHWMPLPLPPIKADAA